MEFKTAYGKRKRQPFETVGETLTQQHFAKETDIKSIINKHDRTGIITHVARGIAQYGDYSEVNEYREALDIVSKADDSFATLPSEIRAMFQNDAGAFFEFATNPNNDEKMVELGLRAAPPSSPVEAQPAQTETKVEEKSDE